MPTVEVNLAAAWIEPGTAIVRSFGIEATHLQGAQAMLDMYFSRSDTSWVEKCIGIVTRQTVLVDARSA
ncbi:MAG TPA: hypothetical protein VIW24_27895 [Aldersonia sp.]